MDFIWSESNEEDSDWIKSLSWDLPTDAKSFINFIGEEKLENFMNLPAAKAMPNSLRKELIKMGYTFVPEPTSENKNLRMSSSSTEWDSIVKGSEEAEIEENE